MYIGYVKYIFFAVLEGIGLASARNMRGRFVSTFCAFLAIAM